MEYMELVKLGLEIGIPMLVGAGGAYYLMFKKKLHEVRVLFDDLDNAWQDDKVSMDEFDKVWEDAKLLVKK